MVKIIEIEGPALLWYTARFHDDAEACAYSPSATLGKRTHKVRIPSSLLA